MICDTFCFAVLYGQNIVRFSVQVPRVLLTQLILHHILGYWGSVHEVIVAHPLVCVLFGFKIWMCVLFGSIRLEHFQRLNQGTSILSRRHSVFPNAFDVCFCSSLTFSFCSWIDEPECLARRNPAAPYRSINSHPE